VLNSFPAIADMNEDQPVVFYYIDPGYALERHAGKSKFKGKFYYQYEREDSWTHPGVRPVFARNISKLCKKLHI
jgi:hypothetical protein